jgi:hypothetical protein
LSFAEPMSGEKWLLEAKPIPLSLPPGQWLVALDRFFASAREQESGFMPSVDDLFHGIGGSAGDGLT